MYTLELALLFTLARSIKEKHLGNWRIESPNWILYLPEGFQFATWSRWMEIRMAHRVLYLQGRRMHQLQRWQSALKGVIEIDIAVRFSNTLMWFFLMTSVGQLAFWFKRYTTKTVEIHNLHIFHVSRSWKILLWNLKFLTFFLVCFVLFTFD